MKNCKECDRSLLEDEYDYCPACKSAKSHNTKRWFEIAGTVLTQG